MVWVSYGCGFGRTRRSPSSLAIFPLRHHLRSRYAGQAHIGSRMLNGAGIRSFIRVTRIWASSILNGVVQTTSG